MMKNKEIKTLIEQGMYFIKTIIDSLLPDEENKKDKKDDKERDTSNDRAQTEQH